MKGKTSSGYKFDINEEKLKEWDFMDLLSDAESEDDSVKLRATVSLVKYIFGADYGKFIDHIKKQNEGRAPVEAVLNEVTAVLVACNTAKK